MYRIPSISEPSEIENFVWANGNRDEAEAPRQRSAAQFSAVNYSCIPVYGLTSPPFQLLPLRHVRIANLDYHEFMERYNQLGALAHHWWKPLTPDAIAEGEKDWRATLETFEEWKELNYRIT